MSNTDVLNTTKSDFSSAGKRKAIIIGAGPAGLTAAYELLKRTDIVPIILEKSGDIGGISKTVNYKGNRMDIGGHRFFSKSDRVMNWWLNIMPVQSDGQDSINISYQNKSREISAVNGSGVDPDTVMLVRKRLSRIYFLRKFFTYPIQLTFDTLKKLGFGMTITILWSYLRAQLLPLKPERNLEDFMINRFGRTLYRLFFKDYTEKVWGQPCNMISVEWGAQRIKGVSISKAIRHAVQTALKQKQRHTDVSQKNTETSLIEQFLYPKYGPGQLWEEVARRIKEMGGTILMHHDVKRIHLIQNGNSITAVAAVNNMTGETSYLEGDYFLSTMPVQDLIGGMDGSIPDDVREVAAGLQYRDFITVGILLKKLSLQDQITGEWKPLVLEDTWIYIQEKDVKVGRLQLFNNWSPYMVKDPDTMWVGMEFFCNMGDSFWELPDNAIKQLAIHELEKIGLASDSNVLDATVLRMEKTYPAYFGTYDRFNLIQEYVDKFENLFLIGRNGMHKYNNSDHSMLTAMVAVDNISDGLTDKANIWAINTEREYHEEKVSAKQAGDGRRIVENSEHYYASGLSFKGFLLKHLEHKRNFWIATIVMIVQFILFKYFYPFASYIHGDSFVYIDMAKSNADIDTFPIGYPRFLRLFSVFSGWDTALVACQYIFIQVSALFLLSTIFYFYLPGRITRRVLLAFIILNPLPLYLANLISSDAIFLSLSFSWFALLLWIIEQPRVKFIVAHALILFFAFTFRYNALIYPIIAMAAFGISRLSFRRKLVGVVLGFLFCGLFIVYTGNKYKKLTGAWQFSPFSGWQLANNAMYTYREVDSAKRRPVPERFRKLDNMIRTYFDSTGGGRGHPTEELPASTVYMWSPGTPLMVYMDMQFPKDSTAEASLKRWASVGPLYVDYGRYIIRQYPGKFAIHFLWPTAQNYYAPPVEFMELYNGGHDSVDVVAQQWFGYKSRKVTTRSQNAERYTLGFYPILTGLMNMVLICCIVCFVLLNGHKVAGSLRRILLIVIIFWGTNAGFTIFASPAALRFQAFPMMLVTIFAIVLLDWMVKQMSIATEKKISEKQSVGDVAVKVAGMPQP